MEAVLILAIVTASMGIDEGKLKQDSSIQHCNQAGNTSSTVTCDSVKTNHASFSTLKKKTPPQK